MSLSIVRIIIGWTVARMVNEEFILIFRSGTCCKMATWTTSKGIKLKLKKPKLLGFGPQANSTGRATAVCR
jgi:hypothetical protein